jgi:adenosylcobinamide hydrolase
MDFNIPGISIEEDDEAIILHSQTALSMLSSAVVGGGFLRAKWILVGHVPKGYHSQTPAADLEALAARRGVGSPYAGFLTAARLPEKSRLIPLSRDGLKVAVLATAGVSNASCAGVSPPVTPEQTKPGTINILMLVDGDLTPAAMVNGVITATEAKTDVLQRLKVRTPEKQLATGTSSDAILVAATGSGPSLEYAGPATALGWLLAHATRTALAGVLV